MKCIYYNGKNDFKFSDVKQKQCVENEVEVKPIVLGLCGSDIQKFIKSSPDKNYLQTHILGHEICGIVTKVGKNVDNVIVGDRVVVNPFNVLNGTLKCESYSLNDQIVDIVGRNIDGGYSEIIYLPKNCVCKLSDDISSEDAIFIDDIAVALHGIHYINECKKEFNSVAIIGDGPLGILCYRILKKLYSDYNIYLISRNENKLKNLNVNTINFFNTKSYKESFDVVLEVVGGNQSDTLNTAIEIGKKNCLILCYGVYNFNYMANINVRKLFYKQGMLKGINSYCNKYDDFNTAIELLKSKKIKVNDLITNRISFEDSVEYIKNYDKTKDNIKTIFEVNNDENFFC